MILSPPSRCASRSHVTCSRSPHPSRMNSTGSSDEECCVPLCMKAKPIRRWGKLRDLEQKIQKKICEDSSMFGAGFLWSSYADEFHIAMFFVPAYWSPSPAGGLWFGIYLGPNETGGRWHQRWLLCEVLWALHLQLGPTEMNSSFGLGGDGWWWVAQINHRVSQFRTVIQEDPGGTRSNVCDRWYRWGGGARDDGKNILTTPDIWNIVWGCGRGLSSVPLKLGLAKLHPHCGESGRNLNILPNWKVTEHYQSPHPKVFIVARQTMGKCC